MSIEARGAKHAYFYVVYAHRQKGMSNTTSTSTMFDVANSDDEAFGRAMKAAYLRYPQENRWQNHSAVIRKVSGIDWIGPHKFDEIEPID